MRIAVIGAGIAGLTAAAELASAGCAVTLYEKSRGPGGRCATRRSAAGPFDHGAPGFSATSLAFRTQVLAWRAAGWVAVDGGDAAPAWGAPWCACGVPSMNALAQHLATGLPAGVELRADTPVAAIERQVGGADARPHWRLQLLDGSLDATRFDAVSVATPAEQAAVLLSADTALADAMRQTRSNPCWTVMAAWSKALPAWQGNPRSADPHSPLSLALRDDARTGRTPIEGVASRWVLHATPQWSLEHLDAAAADVITVLLAAFARRCGADRTPPVHAAAHRWRYAQVPAPRAEPFGWNPALRLGACGDAWHALGDAGASQPDGIERAWLSGRALAHEVIRSGPGD